MSSLVNIQFRKDDTWRTHRDQTMTAHLAAEAAHDVDAIMATFSPDAEVIVNGQIFNSPEAIRNVHLSLGFGGQGALPNLTSPPLKLFVSDEAIVIEYCIRGRHSGPTVRSAKSRMLIAAFQSLSSTNPQ
jgi:SnoaL-like domain